MTNDFGANITGFGTVSTGADSAVDALNAMIPEPASCGLLFLALLQLAVRRYRG
jgi:hypothetical protein